METGEGAGAETVEMTVSGGVATAQTQTPAPEGFSGKPGDFQKDLALLAGKTETTQTPAVQEQPPVVEPEQPATAPVTPPEVPDKFKNPDGTVNQERIEKSTVNAEEAYQKYAELERKLRQAQNNVASLQKGVLPPATPAAAPVTQYSQFEIQVAQDLINAHAEAGFQLAPAQALAQARVQVRLVEAKHNAEASRIDQIGQQLEDQDRRRELEKIAEHDPWVLSPEGIAKLSEIRENRPHVNAAPNKWTAAYREFLADQAMSQRLNGTVQTPNPKGLTANGQAHKAPPTPVNPAPRVSVQPTGPNLNQMNPDQISAYAASLGTKGEAAFWKSRGLKF